MKCVVSKCKKENIRFQIDINHPIQPFNSDISDLRKLFSYFLHKAPNIEAVKSPLISHDKHDEIFSLIKKGKENEFLFCAHNATIKSELSKLALIDNPICCRCKRFLCKRTTAKSKRIRDEKESDLECFLRHIRNAIAHGRVYIKHGGNYISVFFEDVNPSNNITARIVCNQADLKKWKRILEKAVQDEKEE